jgi:hypothetical protein
MITESSEWMLLETRFVTACPDSLRTVMELASNQAAVLILTALTARLSFPTPSVFVVLDPPTEFWSFLPRSVSASRASSISTESVLDAQTDVPVALLPPLALSALWVLLTTMTDHALAAMDSTLQ